MSRQIRLQNYDPSIHGTHLEYEGHTYMTVAKGRSKFTKFSVDLGYVALFNVKSRTIRGIPAYETVTVLQKPTAPAAPTSSNQVPVGSPVDLEIINLRLGSELHRLQQQLDQHVSNCPVGGLSDKENCWADVSPVCSVLERWLTERGFRHERIFQEVDNSESFYPPKLTKQTATRVFWPESRD